MSSLLWAYLLTRSRIFNDVLDGHPSLKIQLILILVFGALSVYGTVAGVEFMGAIINVRDLGPMVAGLIGGPVRWDSGPVSSALQYRLSLGGLTVYSCSLATVLAGLFGGLIWLANKRKFIGITGAVHLCGDHGRDPHAPCPDHLRAYPADHSNYPDPGNPR